MNFNSDNVAGAAPQILKALAEAAAGRVDSYGEDPLTAKVGQRMAELFDRPVAVFPVATGSAANALALAAIVPPYGAVYCHEASHINTDECGAPEFYTAGAKLVGMPGAHGKLVPDALEAALNRSGAGVVHHVQPAALSLTQATEAGTVYAPAEVAALAEIAHRHDLKVHMDGARFANAVVRLGCAPADITWRAGVDILSFGATKNGALAAEAIVVFDPDIARDIAFRRKRAGHLFSKMRFLSAQLDAYLADGLWLDLARHANAMADRMAAGLARVPGVRIAEPVEANEIFAVMPDALVTGLRDAGFAFHRWGEEMVRLVTAFDTDPADVDALIAAAGKLAAG